MEQKVFSLFKGPQNKCGRQCGQVVRAPDLKLGDPEFKSDYENYLDMFR